LISDPAGNHYGTAQQERDFERRSCVHARYYRQGNNPSQLAGAPDGANPVGGLVRDSQGNLYGTTEAGGESTCPWTCGTVFKIDAAGSETILHSFNGYDGQFPESGVILDAAGNLFGTAETGGGSGYGTVFKVDAVTGEEPFSTPSPAEPTGLVPGLAWSSMEPIFTAPHQSADDSTTHRIQG